MVKTNGLAKFGSNSASLSPLLRLPAELRNMVYIYTLGGNTWSINMGRGRTKPRADNAAKNALALLQVNRQIYAEAHLFPYLYNTFEGRHNGHLREWVQSLPSTHRKSITSIKRYQRSYLIEGAQGVDVSPIFWMDTPTMGQWKLKGLKRIEVEVALQKWGWNSNEEETKAAKVKALAKLRKLLEEEHPGVIVNVVLRRGY
ncbi:hypothetical protein BU25DRAFT_494780 [Macroventuria anomochaeta]|uniref:Uncharacterized protein n=1 Tax=Macroventuria anomochaeta TaxID=301207 RepID=A0ACB6RLK7_9PLEO|nr:uncharacterized protein BU25DRAFT_494780 [Macroventuria anomochaeta]KAF2622683.1 hypothetical protein BU25DRAFT_494780 [Macroventuria anomochaeta]